MPNYKKLTIANDSTVLDGRVKAIAQVEKMLQGKDIAAGPKQSLQSERMKLITEIRNGVDKVLLGCDDAERNNRDFCQFLSDAHKTAKQYMDKLPTILKMLETKYEDKLAFLMLRVVGQIEEQVTLMQKETEEILGSGMINDYRDNGWPKSVRAALAYVPERKDAFLLREKNREEGIGLGNTANASKLKVKEYLVRALAMRKTAESLLNAEMGVQKELLQVRKEVADFTTRVEKDVKGLLGEAEGTTTNMNNYVKQAMGVKTVTKDTYKIVLQYEPKIESFSKKLKAKAKTLRIEFGEEAKKALALGPKGMDDPQLKPQLMRADSAIKQLEKEVDAFIKETGPFKKVVEMGKRLK